MKWLNLILATISATFHHNGWSERAVSRVSSYLPLLACTLNTDSLTHSDLPGIILSESLVLLDNNLNTHRQAVAASYLSVVLSDWTTPLSTMNWARQAAAVFPRFHAICHRSLCSWNTINSVPALLLHSLPVYFILCLVIVVLCSCGNGSLIISFHSYANFNYDRVSGEETKRFLVLFYLDAKRLHPSLVIPSFALSQCPLNCGQQTTGRPAELKAKCFAECCSAWLTECPIATKNTIKTRII